MDDGLTRAQKIFRTQIEGLLKFSTNLKKRCGNERLVDNSIVILTTGDRLKFQIEFRFDVHRRLPSSQENYMRTT